MGERAQFTASQAVPAAFLFMTAVALITFLATEPVWVAFVKMNFYLSVMAPFTIGVMYAKEKVSLSSVGWADD